MRQLKPLALYAAVTLLLFVFFLLVISFSKHNSAVWDEPTTIAIGHYFRETGDFRINPSHPPLTHYLSSVFVRGVILPDNYESYVEYSYVSFAHDFVISQPMAYRDLLFRSRLPFMLLSAVLCIFVFLWAKELNGNFGGLLSLTLFVLSPTIIAYSSLALTDMVLATFYFLSVFFFWKYIKRPSLVLFFLISAMFSLALVSKFTGLFLAPVFLLIYLLALRNGNFNFPCGLCMRITNSRLRNFVKFIFFMATIFLVSFLVVFIFYQFQLTPLSESVPERFLGIGADKSPLPMPLYNFVVYKIPFPAASYLAGVAEQAFASSVSYKTAYFDGEIYSGRKIQFHLVEFFLKSPIPFLLLVILSFFYYFESRSKFSKDLIFLLLPALFYFGMFMVNTQNISIRHLLPVYPFLFVLSSGAVHIKFKRSYLKYAYIFFVSFMLLWSVISILSVHPHEIGYFNELVGRERASILYSPGNIDEGQDLEGLISYLNQQNITDVQLSYFGSNNPHYLGLNYTYLPSPYFQPWVPNYAPDEGLLVDGYVEDCSPKTGFIAISLTNLKNVFLLNKTCYSWLDDYSPIGQIGYSIYLYEIPEE